MATFGELHDQTPQLVGPEMPPCVCRVTRTRGSQLCFCQTLTRDEVPDGSTKLIAAVRGEDEPYQYRCGENEDYVKLLLARGELVDDVDCIGRTALLHAATMDMTDRVSCGHKSYIRILLDAGANIDHQMGEGNTALMEAVSADLVDNAMELIAAGANVKLTNKHGLSAMHYATVSSIPRPGPLVEALLKAGADPNVVVWGMAPIHLAAREGNMDAVCLLVHARVSVDTPDAYGKTPLHDAVECKRHACAIMLVGLGANLGARTMYGETPLDTATRVKDAAMIAILKQAAIEPRARSV